MVWCHPILWGIAASLLVWGLLFLPEYIIEKKAVVRDHMVITLTPWKRDGNGNPTKEVHEFDPRLEHYLKVAEIIIGLASASLIFIPTLHAKNINCWFAFALVLLGFTVFFGFFFMAVMTYFYEMFLFNPKSFGPFRSSFMFSLGFSSFACFAGAYLTIAIQLGLAYANGSLTTVVLK